MRIRISNLTEIALDWLVNDCNGMACGHSPEDFIGLHEIDGLYNYSTNWAQGGPIIEQEGLHLRKSGCEWQCDYWNDSTLNFDTSYGPTILIAAMRCFVASKLGDTVEVSGELMGKID